MYDTLLNTYLFNLYDTGNPTETQCLIYKTDLF